MWEGCGDDSFSSELAVSRNLACWLCGAHPLHGALDVGLECYLGLLKDVMFITVKAVALRDAYSMFMRARRLATAISNE